MHKLVQNILALLLFTVISITSYANAPIITSLSVTSGPVGSTVTIKGTDFPGTVAWTEVYFGNARVTNYTYASATSLTVTVPVGATYGPVIVYDRVNVRYGTSNVFFNPTFSPNKGSIAAGDMTTSSAFTTGNNPLAVAVGDVDGDAKPDVVVVNNSDNTVSVFRNTSTTGNFSFDAKVDYATGVKPSAVLIADMDNDRKPDIVVLNNGSTNVSVFKNNCTSGTISFAARVNGATGTTGYNSNAIAVGDIDHDGLLDVIATNGLKNTISVLLNTSTSTAISFATKVEYPTGASPRGVAIGDIDGDKNIDIVVTNNSDNSVSVIRNLTSMTGTSSMATKVDYSVGTGPQAVALADIDRDGKVDIITSNYSSGNISILRNTSVSGTVSLGSAVNKTTAASAQSIGLADIDGDGKVDITNANSASILSVLKNTTTSTTPTFAAVIGFSTSTANIYHTMGDIDGDGKIDAVVVNNTSNSFVILRNTPSYSNNANLSALTTTAGTISPAFSASTLSYTASVPNTTASITITATKQQDSAKLQIQMNGGNYVNINSGSPSMLYILASGENTFNIKVTAQDSSIKTYTLVVTKAAVPIITAITPSSAAVGTSVTLTGNYFNSTSANNIVFFGGVQAAVTAATATSLTVTVPIGTTYGPVTVLNSVALLTGTSKVFFNPTFNPNKGSIDTMDMTVSANFGVNGYPSNLAVGDIDGDGKSDAVVLDKVNSKLSVLRNTSSSGSVSFAPKVDFTTLSSTETISLGDINNDGKLDVVVVNFLTDSVSIFRNTSTNGSISFAAKVNILCGLSIGTYRKCVIGDIDGDGKPDITLGTYSLGQYVISVLRNTSTSATNLSFDFFTTFVTGNNPIDLAIGDIDKDGKADIVTANKNPANATGTAYYQISILKNTSVIGTISFATKQDFTVDGQPSSIALADIDGDGVNDIVTCNVGTNNISVLINYSNTSGLYMGTLRNFSIGANTGYMDIADIDGDGRLDIAVTPNAKGLYILRNVTTTTGASNVSFAPVVTLAKAINLSSIVTGDIDGDGKVDIAAVNTTAAADSLVVLRNTPILSRNNNLSSLSATVGYISPVFDSLTTAYTINVHNTMYYTIIKATVADTTANMQVQINGGVYTALANGASTASLPLNVGVNTINVKVTAQNGAVKTYTITVTRACLASPSTTNLSVCASQLPYSWNGITFNAAGTKYTILTTANGCDSTVTLNLSLKANTTSWTDMNICDSAVWNGVTYKKTGQYVYHTTNSVGCDSAATLNLTIKKPTTSWTDLLNCDSAYWNGVWYKQSGFYVIHLTNKNGCDSAAALNLTIKKAAVSTTNLVACDSIFWNGVYYKTSGQYVYHTIYQGGCDSAATLNLTIKKSSSSITNITACDTFTWHGITYQASGQYVYHTNNSIGCDSAAILNLTIKRPTSSWTDLIACDSALWNGTWYKQNGFYTYHTTNKAGCDSAAALNLTIKKPTYSMTDIVACDSLVWFGIVYKTSGQYTFHTTNSVGCDSATIVNLTINKATTKTTNLTGCVVTYKGITYTSSAVLRDTLKNRQGCDSIYNLVNITISSNSVQGGVFYPNNKLIPNITTYITGTVNDSLAEYGSYYFGCLPSLGNYKVKTKKNREITKANGVSTIDAALVQSHVLGKAALSSPYKIIAADVNGDNKVSALDIVLIKRLILGLDTTFTKSVTNEKRLWAFTDSSYVFANNANPFPIKDSINFIALNGDLVGQNFIGMKLGDVNWDWNPALSKPYNNTVNAVELSYDETKLNKDGSVSIPVKVKNFKDMMGMQFTLGYNADALTFRGIDNNILNLEMGVHHSQEGKLSMLWLDDKNTIKTLDDGTVIMVLLFEKTGKALNNNEAIVIPNALSVDGSITAVEAFDKDYQIHGVVMKPSNINIAETAKESFTVSPNPAIDGVIHVQMNLRDNKVVVLKLLDNTGRLLLSKKLSGTKGANQFTISDGKKIAAGMYYIQAVGIEGVKPLMMEAH